MVTSGRPRVRQWGLPIGELRPGRQNGIIDVAGVCVGHTTLVSGEGPLRPGCGPVRTGVTVILPHGDDLFRHKVSAAVHTINGYGKPCGFEQVRELGVIEAPIALTNTLNVPLVADGLIQYSVRRNPDIGVSVPSVNVVVGETNDGYLNDLQGRHVRAEHVWRAIEGASCAGVAEGAVGAGTGTTCFGWKGGIGTASRVLPEEGGGFHVGALVQTNFGRADQLTISGVPVGRLLESDVSGGPPGPGGGSVMIVLATDAPLSSRQLHRLCKRAPVGLARTGALHDHGSGDFVVAFSTACHTGQDPPALLARRVALVDEERAMFWLFPAVVECVEEAVLNPLWRAETVVGRDGNTRLALPLERVADVVRARRVGSE